MGKTTFLLLLIAFLSGAACKDNNGRQAQDSRAIETQTTEALKEASKNYLKAWSNNDTALIKKIAIRNIVRNVNGEITSSDQNGLNETIEYWHTALPDFKVVENEIIVQGNRCYVNWTSNGTNTGMLGEMTPTGKKSETVGFSVLTFDDKGLLIHESAYFDMLGVMEDWGYTLLPPHLE
ncbi:ester cyclase [Maribacter aestuarii]|uniref:ester cyclase n=1 Tax=Maribacter aestuarii TaxID=1130723 RepID=UPI00248AD8EC|nr:ester cyclase [Maribacter aestuarii]